MLKSTIYPIRNNIISINPNRKSAVLKNDKYGDKTKPDNIKNTTSLTYTDILDSQIAIILILLLIGFFLQQCNNRKDNPRGTYEKEYENQEYYDEGFHSKEVNALEFFASHKIKDNYEIDKIYKDESLLSLLIQYNNTDIIEHCLNLFFCDYSIDSFLDVVNNLNQPNNTF